MWNSEEISKKSLREHFHNQKRVLFLFNFEQAQIGNCLNYCNYPAQKGKMGKSELHFLQIKVFYWKCAVFFYWWCINIASNRQNYRSCLKALRVGRTSEHSEKIFQ